MSLIFASRGISPLLSMNTFILYIQTCAIYRHRTSMVRNRKSNASFTCINTKKILKLSPKMMSSEKAVEFQQRCSTMLITIIRLCGWMDVFCMLFMREQKAPSTFPLSCGNEMWIHPSSQLLIQVAHYRQFVVRCCNQSCH